ncbi:prepilin-type N-terminal cleavage/methylation domain-containing protein [Acidisoma sp.]|uniref:prepilin-type N-terminal cleavage/methylation domain-containing protein n=1 Tax=Acidisoma sp. TaxID=1872115 RepID=UPI003B0070A5
MRSGKSAAGFTLLEVLVSLVVLALIILGLSQGLRFGVLAFQHQAATIDRAANLDAVDRTLRGLIEQIDPGNRHDAPEIAGNARSVEFTSELPEGAAAALGSREAEIRILVDHDHRLILRWAPYRHAKPAGPPTPPVDTVLLPQVDHITISYWAHAGPPHWLATWNSPEVPALIRISLTFQHGTGIDWPDIVAAPQRSRP